MIMLSSVIATLPDDDDRNFMEWLYKEHYRLMFYTAWKIFKDKATVDDVVSESCVALIKNITTLRGLERNKLRIYIVSTVRNTSLNFYDKRQRNNSHLVSERSEAIETAASGIDIEKKIMLKDELQRVWQAIAQLPIKEQQIIRMKYVMEMPDEKIAEKLGIAPSSVRQCIGRIRKRLKAMLFEK